MNRKVRDGFLRGEKQRRIGENGGRLVIEEGACWFRGSWRVKLEEEEKRKEGDKKGASSGMPLMTPCFYSSSDCSIFFLSFFGYFLVASSLIQMWIACS